MADDDAGGAAAVEALVGVRVLLAAGEGHDLGGDVGAQLLLAGAALDDHVHRRTLFRLLLPWNGKDRYIYSERALGCST